jgi:hypothetical protein
MKNRKSLLAILLSMLVVLLQPKSVLALNGTVGPNPHPHTPIVTSKPAPLNQDAPLNQPLQLTPKIQDTALTDTPAMSTQVFLPIVSASQTIYYVSPAGNDSNPGTINDPWHTIQKAADTLVAGETVQILPGTYSEKFVPKNSGTAEAYITYTAEPGTVVLDGAGVSLSGDIKGDGLVQILGKRYIKVQNLALRNASVNCVNISDDTSGTRPAYIEISALTLQNCNKVGIRARSADHLQLNDNQINHVNYASGIGVWTSTDVTVDHNTITNAHYYHECQGAYDEALTIAGTNQFEVMNNTLDNTEANPAGFCTNAEKLGINVKESSQNGRVYHNTVRHMTAASIYVDGWHAGANGTPSLNHIAIYQNQVSDGGGITIGCEQADGIVEYITIHNNLLLNTTFAGIQVRGAHGDGLRKNITIANNTLYGALAAGGNGGAGIYVTTAHLASNNGEAPVIIRNNISMFYFLPSGGWVGQIVAGNATIAALISADHNLVSGPQNCSAEYPACVEVGSRISAAPDSVFSNPAAFDLHLKSGSPAIDAGITLGAVPDDLEGLPRPAGSAYDLGAYESK